MANSALLPRSMERRFGFSSILVQIWSCSPPKTLAPFGINPNALVFNRRAITANGEVRIAPVVVREIRIEQLSIDNVAAAIQEQNLKRSLLGLSFLKRLKSFEMREGVLTISW